MCREKGSRTEEQPLLKIFVSYVFGSGCQFSQIMNG